ncbi:hypothetical protein SEPCBS119000_000551 [Sporothrix epigloea]|uniref:N-acetyltransferase domain-containing protein n=1 Tax=Sporothrix epigloea TaxID=1892477 RepID=A0ABP0D629_9PEZI
MSLTMRPATDADIDRLMEVYFSAFRSNDITPRVFPESSPQTHAFWRSYFTRNLENDLVDIRVVETASGSGSEGQKIIIAFAVWDTPRQATEPFPAMPPPSVWPTDGDVAAAVEFFGDLEQQHKRFMGPVEGAPAGSQQRPHWYLKLIGTHQDFRGKGAAGALLRHGEQLADAQGLPCYLDATPEGRPVYTSAGHGFREVDIRWYLGGTYEHVFMIRDPRPLS